MIKINAIFIALLVLCVCTVITFVLNPEQKNENWAVLVAGSKGYFNYRHQADVAHAYQLLLNRGFDKNKIVTMMFNDIVNNKQNPRKGKLFNNLNGTDVYNGIIIDYIGGNVTVENFIGVLNGKGKYGKVLKVKSTERVFIFLSDHGSRGVFAFPSGILTTNQLVKEVKNLGKISKGVTIFVESCESGSLFLDHITKKDKKILAFTASNETESSWACYWSDEMGAYLGDHFSVSWMESIESMDTKKTTFIELYNIVKNLTYDSHVLNFGDKLMLDLKLIEFFGTTSENSISNPESLSLISKDNVPSYDSQLSTMIRSCKKNLNKKCLDDIQNLQKSIRKLDLIFNKLKSELKIFKAKNNVASYISPYPDHVYTCYSNSVMLFSRICINYNEVEKTFKYLGLFLQMCSNGMDEQRIADLIKTNC